MEGNGDEHKRKRILMAQDSFRERSSTKSLLHPTMIPIDELADTFPEFDAKVKIGARFASHVPYSNIIDEEQGVLVNVVLGGRPRLLQSTNPTSTQGVTKNGRSDEEAKTEQEEHNLPPGTVNARMYPRCGPRAKLFFDPSKVVAGIVTCGGLCPGLNSVVRDITLSLFDLYGASNVFGFHGGWDGIYARPPTRLDRENTQGIQHLGGTILSSGRGGFDLDKIIAKLDEFKIDQLYVVGGDGTMRGALALSEGLKKHKRPIAIIGIPKTIDNDIDLIDRSFGFQTAVEESLRAVRAARVEASCCINGVGIVKVMGRSAGFIATHVTLSSGDVDLCLIPEISICADGGENCEFAHVARMVKQRGCAVIVVAEGAGEEILGRSAETDAGGNRKLPEIGPWVKDQVLSYMKKIGEKCSVKYIDPSYMVRSGPANASDALYCLILSQGAVHSAMAGMTNFCVGLVNGRSVMLPIASVVATSPRAVDPRGRTWERVVSLTGQPHKSDLSSLDDTHVDLAKGLMSRTVV